MVQIFTKCDEQLILLKVSVSVVIFDGMEMLVQIDHCDELCFAKVFIFNRNLVMACSYIIQVLDLEMGLIYTHVCQFIWSPASSGGARIQRQWGLKLFTYYETRTK